MSEKIRLNIGAGGSNLPGFIPLDIQTGTDATLKLPYADGSVAEVYASHVLEHIHHSKTANTLTEWVRVLQPGGRIRIAVPDFQALAESAATGDMTMAQYSAWLYGTHDVPTDRHQAAFSYNDLEMHLRSLGIEDIGRWEPEYQDCSRIPGSILIGGRKRVITIKSNPKVVMILSTARFGPTDFYHSVAEVCRIRGWKLLDQGGDNWAKVMTSKLKQAIFTENADYVLTLDFDSAFDAEEAASLVDFLQVHPDIGAVFPVQAHRHGDLPLGYAVEAAASGYYDYSKNNGWNGVFTRYGSGHFGCTAIRREVFLAMPQPWFAGLPSPKTLEWDGDALDNDISFWMAMHGHGFVFGQVNTVQIGHMELCVKWIAGDKIFWQPIQHYRKHGRPKNAVFDGEAWNKRTRKLAGIKEPEPVAAEVPATSITPEPIIAINQTIASEYFPLTQSASVTQPGESRLHAPSTERQANG